MNERIRELVGKAKFMAEETINRQISKNAELDAFAEKFVELIVRECADRLMQNDFASSKGMMRIAGAKLKEHFGVEE